MVGTFNCEEGMVLEIGIVSLVGVGVSADVKTDPVVDHRIEVVVQSKELIEAP